jgi:hypothetical protein
MPVASAPTTPSRSDSPASASSHRRPSLWKRLGRRGSKTASNSSTTSSNQDVPVEADNGNARSLSAKRAQRLAAVAAGSSSGTPSLSDREQRGRSHSRESGGAQPSGLFGKIRNSVRRGGSKTRNSRTEDVVSQHHNDPGSARSSSSDKNHPTAFGNSLHSPAYSTDSYQTIEVSEES